MPMPAAFKRVAKAKALGVYKGRKKSVDAEAVRSLRASCVGASQVAKQMGISRASVYRSLSDEHLRNAVNAV